MTDVIALGDAIDAINSVGFTPWGIAVIGKEIFVSQYNVTTYKIKVFDADTYSVKREFNINGVTANQYGSIGTDGTNLMVSNSSECIVTVDKQNGTAIKTGTIVYRFSLTSTFDVDLERDLIVFQQYTGGSVRIIRYSTGVILNTYKMPTSSTGSGAIIYRKKGGSEAYIVVSQYFNNMIFVSGDISKSTDNLTFSHIYTYNNTSKITGLGLKGNQLFIGVYSPSSKIVRLDISSLIIDKFLISSEDRLYSVDNPPLKSSASTTANDNFPAQAAIDGIVLTNNANGSRWSSALNDTGASFMIEFPFSIEIDQIRFLQYKHNNSGSVHSRIRNCEVTFSNGAPFQTTLNDASVDYNQVPTESNWSVIQFPSRKTSFVKIQRLSSYAGSPDYISFIEFEVYSKGKKITKDMFIALKALNNSTEENYLKHGMSSRTEINLDDKIVGKKFIVNQNTTLGSGKVFKQKIDTSKIPIKNASIT